ncbi:uncharacterized protein FA14DRAFT_156851 [Meira miltonrushii]|uniref:Uncharacterized protein n=1 Tax=Meira miltonrushii TaxID=1280837 RepID=A0A316VAS5_9BASI|nr:uncharacterized protein FA14DRAFT_156851 [Meira miltonrushii]PWN34188.1 hypothetical protein FA14DRAFT_156851 [Meira miltonrushii]
MPPKRKASQSTQNIPRKNARRSYPHRQKTLTLRQAGTSSSEPINLRVKGEDLAIFPIEFSSDKDKKAESSRQGGLSIIQKKAATNDGDSSVEQTDTGDHDDLSITEKKADTNDSDSSVEQTDTGDHDDSSIAEKKADTNDGDNSVEQPEAGNHRDAMEQSKAGEQGDSSTVERYAGTSDGDDSMEQLEAGEQGELHDTIKII